MNFNRIHETEIELRDFSRISGTPLVNINNYILVYHDVAGSMAISIALNSSQPLTDLKAFYIYLTFYTVLSLSGGETNQTNTLTLPCILEQPVTYFYAVNL